MRNTVADPPLTENRSDKKDEYALINSIRKALNQGMSETHEVTTTLTAAATEIWLSDDMPMNTTWFVETDIVGFATDGSAAGYKRIATFKRVTGGSVLVGAVSLAITQEDVAGWDVAIAASGNGVQLTVTGDVTRTVNWKAHLLVTEVRG